jgi:integrase
MTATISVEDLLGQGLSYKTAYLYARALDRALLDLERQGVDLETCGARHLALVASRWPSSRSSKGHLRAALGHAWEILDRDQCPTLRSVKLPPLRRMRCLALEPDQAMTLERAAFARGDLPGLAVLIGLYTGLRRAEIAALRWEHFQAGAGGVLAWVTVTGKGQVTADVPVHPVLAGILEGWRRPAGWVFPARTGRDGHASPATIWAWVAKVGDSCSVPVRTHLLRHTALAEANDRSGDLRAVQSFARHSRPETTAGYTRTTSRRLAEVVSLIDYGRSNNPTNPIRSSS